MNHNGRMTTSRPSPTRGGPRTGAMHVVELLRRLQTEGDRLGSAVASRERVGHSDMAALMHIMEADVAGEPLTATRLQHLLGLTSGATTTVIDRLESAGHARRERGATDRRQVLLRYDTGAEEVGRRYFAPLGQQVAAVMTDYDDDQLAIIDRFLSEVVSVYARHTDAVRRGEVGGSAHP